MEDFHWIVLPFLWMVRFLNAEYAGKRVQELVETKGKEMEKALARIFRIRYQKEHWFQVKYDVPGLTEERFNPVRYWKK